ncbi:8-oxoguanine glycosylase ogg1 [Myotisia sp. PD_48]|nr:8-oxoguanine glycosylase ogg1 [Myotisia sp. PD_48]
MQEKNGNMSIAKFSEWRKLPMTLTELCINTTLRCGQTFRWRKTEDDEWICTLYGRVLSLRQEPSSLSYRSYAPTNQNLKHIATTAPVSAALDVAQQNSVSGDDTEALIRHYFNLNCSLSDLYEQWAVADQNFKKKAMQFTGIRILQQDAWEALVSFICSSNNNIARISQMVEKLCVNYGPLIAKIGDREYYDFPSPSALVGSGVESRLRELGFGYRAKYISQTAMKVANMEPGWLNSLRNPEKPAFGEKLAGSRTILSPEETVSYREAHEQLLALQGVGPKVADCVCLMGLGWGESVPVDTHVWQIAQRDYKFGKGKQKTLSKATYDLIGDHFRKLWGKEAGWAHSVLFTADLKTFASRLTTKIETKEEDIKAFETTDIKIEEEDMRTSAEISVKRELVEDIAGLDESIDQKSPVNTRASKRLRVQRSKFQK